MRIPFGKVSRSVSAMGSRTFKTKVTLSLILTLITTSLVSLNSGDLNHNFLSKPNAELGFITSESDPTVLMTKTLTRESIIGFIVFTKNRCSLNFDGLHLPITIS